MADLEADRKLLAALEGCEEWQKCQRGEPFLAFGPEILAARERCYDACERFNNTTDRSRRNMVRLWKEITLDFTPLPSPPQTTTTTTTTPTPPGPPSHPTMPPSSPPLSNPLATHPTILPPIHIDYGLNVHLSEGVFINVNATFIDPVPITIGARTLIGPNCNFFAGTHPLDPAVRQGCDGPELAHPIVVEEDCWFGGNVIVLPRVRVGRGSTVGAGSVVTKDVPPFHVVAGNPARIIRRIESVLEHRAPTDQSSNSTIGTSTH